MSDKPRKLHRCPKQDCNASFARPYRLAQHMLVHDNIKAFPCSIKNCTKSYTSKSHLDRHINSAHDEPSNDIIYSCPRCLKKYANRQNLKRHIKIHHNLKVPYSCDTCKLEFQKKHQLSTHMYGHTGIKAFSCDICSLEFVSLFEKKRHARFHKTYSCSKCNLKFTQWSKYQKHLKMDHHIEDYICDSCGRNFKKRNHILRHVKIHDLTKVFQCPYDNCKRFYSTNSNLKQHFISTHEKLKHECSICEAKLSTKAKLNQHVLKYHTGHEVKRKPPKIKATGRKPRKDLGAIKISTAIRLAGIPQIVLNSSETSQFSNDDFVAEVL